MAGRTPTRGGGAGVAVAVPGAPSAGRGRYPGACAVLLDEPGSKHGLVEEPGAWPYSSYHRDGRPPVQGAVENRGRGARRVRLSAPLPGNRGALKRTLRLLRLLKAGGKGYQSRMNAILRREMLAQRGKG